MKTSTKFLMLGLSLLLLALVTSPVGTHVFALPDDQAAMDTYLAGEGRRDVLAIIGSLMAVVAFAVQMFAGRGPTICSRHEDPDLRKRANQLLRDAGCNVHDPRDRIDAIEMEVRIRREYTFYRRMVSAMAIMLVVVTATTAMVIQSKWNMVMTSIVLQMPDCNAERTKCEGIDWGKLRVDIERHPGRYFIAADKNSS